MAETESTMKWKVDITQFTSAMQEAKKALQSTNDEFKLSTSTMDKWSNNTTGLEAKIKQLGAQIEANSRILEIYKQALKEAQEAGDTKNVERYNKLIADQQIKINKTQVQLDKYSDKLSEMTKEQAKSESATAKLNQEIEDQQKKVDALKKAYKDSLVGDNPDEAKRLAKELQEASSELVDLKKTMSDAEKVADDLDVSLKDVDGSTVTATEGFTVMKGVLADLISKGITAAVNGLKNLANEAVEAYKAFDEGADNVIKATGATGQAAEELEQSYKKVSQSVIGDFGNIGSALGEVNTRFGFTGQALEDATVQFVKFADITGSDAVTAVQLVSRAMGDAGIDAEDYAQVLDDLAIAAQASGIGVDKLAENLTKYGAPMRQLGFDTKESIAIFSQWEKAGVNTEIAFSGMKKAISNWAKDGKDARVEFKKTLDEIASTPDIAAATTKAIEVFGAKAGPDLADAIQNGRFEYSSFLDLLEGSTGTVEKTYEQTQDGFDKVNLAIQGVKAEMGSYVGALLTTYQPQIERFVKKATKVLKELMDKAIDGAKWLKKNAPVILTTLKSIATAFITYKAVATITSVVTAFTKLFNAVKAGTGIIKTFNSVIGLNPYALAAAGLVALVTAVISYRKNTEKAIQAQYGLNEADKEAIEQAKELKSTYDDLNTSRNEQVDTVNAEFGYIKELKDEYNGLIDSNGKVKEGYEDRAKFILNQLAKALGVEVDEIQKVIDQNGKLGDSIDKLIQKKQAEAVLSANEEMYTEAIRNRTDALNTLTEAQKVYEEAEQRYLNIAKDSEEATQNYFDLLFTSPNAARTYYYANQDIIKGGQAAKEAFEEAKAGLKDAEDAYIGYNSTIQNYEGLSAAIISGDSEKINSALMNMTYNFITAETGNRESLERQVTNYKTNLSNLEAAIRNGTPGVTQEMVDQAKSMVTAAEKELDKLPPEASATGQQSGQNFAEGVGSKKAEARTQGENLAKEASKGADSEKENAKASGSNFGEGFFNGIGSWFSSVWEQGKALAKKAWSGLKKGQEEGSPSRLTRQSGIFFGEGYLLGIEEMVNPVTKAASDLASEALIALGKNMNTQMYDIGVEGSKSLIDGMSGVIPNMQQSISNLKSGVASANYGVTGYTGAAGSATSKNTSVTNMNFYQTNNSPKALNRWDIYRQTQNILALAKG